MKDGGLQITYRIKADATFWGRYTNALPNCKMYGIYEATVSSWLAQCGIKMRNKETQLAAHLHL